MRKKRRGRERKGKGIKRVKERGMKKATMGRDGGVKGKERKRKKTKTNGKKRG